MYDIYTGGRQVLFVGWSRRRIYTPGVDRFYLLGGVDIGYIHRG